MAAPVRNDAKLAAGVRRKALLHIEKILDGEDNEYQRQILLKLAGTVLPRLNEHGGRGGGPIVTKALTDEEFKELIVNYEDQEEDSDGVGADRPDEKH